MRLLYTIGLLALGATLTYGGIARADTQKPANDKPGSTLEQTVQEAQTEELSQATMDSLRIDSLRTKAQIDFNIGRIAFELADNTSFSDDYIWILTKMRESLDAFTNSHLIYKDIGDTIFAKSAGTKALNVEYYSLPVAYNTFNRLLTNYLLQANTKIHQMKDRIARYERISDRKDGSCDPYWLDEKNEESINAERVDAKIFFEDAGRFADAFNNIYHGSDNNESIYETIEELKKNLNGKGDIGSYLLRIDPSIRWQTEIAYNDSMLVELGKHYDKLAPRFERLGQSAKEYQELLQTELRLEAEAEKLYKDQK